MLDERGAVMRALRYRAVIVPELKPCWCRCVQFMQAAVQEEKRRANKAAQAAEAAVAQERALADAAAAEAQQRKQVRRMVAGLHGNSRMDLELVCLHL